MTAEDPHADKYNDPRVQITRRGLRLRSASASWYRCAAVSIVGRSTQLEKTSQFWGEKTILALQLGERLELRPRGNETFAPLDLSGSSGLGHLRRLLLDERNFDWTSQSEGKALGQCGEPVPRKPRCIQIHLTDPTANRFDVIQIDLDLQTGWTGPSTGQNRVKLLERTLPKLRKYFETKITMRATASREELSIGKSLN